MIKMRYVAQIEVTDEIERNDSVLPIDEIRQNIATGMIEDSLRDLIATGFCCPKINITRMLADVIELTEGEQS